MPKLLDITALSQGVQASKDYTDQRITDVELNVQQATEEQVQDILDDVFGGMIPVSSANYVTFDSDEPRTITPSYDNPGTTLQYSLDAKTWFDILSKDATPSAKTIYMRGQAIGSKSLTKDIFTVNEWKFSGINSNKLRVTGNLNYLLCDVLGDAVAPTALANNCYCYMFQNCTSLINAPKLPATALADYCYANMFNGCTSLVTAPELPATTLANSCYGGMFSNCTSLIDTPVLPATILTSACYSAMFKGCTSLVIAPELPAAALAGVCYNSMFAGCTSLFSVKIHATTNLYVTNALTSMLNNVKNTGTLTCKTELIPAILATPAGWSRAYF